MGGLVVVVAVLLSTLCLADIYNPFVWVTCGITLAYGALGFVDDFKKVRIKNSAGVRAKTKMAWQIMFAAGFTWLLMATNS